MEQLKTISMPTLRRLPLYLKYLRALSSRTTMTVSAPLIAEALGLNEVQVRKDLSSVSDKGKPKIGYSVVELIADIEMALGYGNIHSAVLVGAGNLGRALLGYDGFSHFNLEIVAAFDIKDDLIGTKVKNKQILSVKKLGNLCARMNIKLAIIAVPEEEAQGVCDLLVASNIVAIWNFAQTNLSVPKEVIVQNENIACSLAMLSKRLTEKKSKG